MIKVLCHTIDLFSSFLITFCWLFAMQHFAQVMGKHLTDDEINMNLNNCKTSGRWIILQGLHNQLENLYRLKFPKTSEKFMICATIPRGVALPEFILSQFRLQVSLKSLVAKLNFLRTLICLRQLLRGLKHSSIWLLRSRSLKINSRRFFLLFSLLLLSPGGLQALLGLCHSLPREDP